jgi:hypothetical protein
MARGKKTPPEKVEEVKALSLIYNPQTVAERTGVAVRTVYSILRTPDDPKMEAYRARKRERVVDDAWNRVDVEGEVHKLKGKCDMILEAIDQRRVDSARITELTTAYGTLFDKSRLLGGKSTENISLIAITRSLEPDFQENDS